MDIQPIIILVIVFVVVAFIIVNIIVSNIRSKKTVAKWHEEDRIHTQERKEYREFIKTVFNPFNAVLDYLDGKVIILSKTEYFTYDKENPKYKIEMDSNGLLGVQKRENEIPYLVCILDDGTEVIVIDVKDEYTPEIADELLRSK